MDLTSWRSPLTQIRPGGIAGRGVFAVAAIPADEVVAVKAGHLLDLAALERTGDLGTHAALRVTPEVWLGPVTAAEAADTMTFLNHCCLPNVGMQANMVAVTMRPIVPGEELTLDYAMFQDDPSFELVCQCVSPQCRGRLTGNDWRDPVLRARYQGFFTWHIQRRIDRGE